MHVARRRRLSAPEQFFRAALQEYTQRVSQDHELADSGQLFFVPGVDLRPAQATTLQTPMARHLQTSLLLTSLTLATAALVAASLAELIGELIAESG
jgi:hypothetical protein